MAKRKRAKKSSKRTARKFIKRPSVSIQKQRSKSGSKSDTVDMTFNNVNDIDRKVDLIKDIPNSEIRKRMRPGKPPKGALIIITLKDGRTITKKTPPDFVVNPANIKAFTEGIIEKMRDDYNEWLSSSQKPSRR